MQDWKTVKKSLLENKEVAAEYKKLSPKNNMKEAKNRKFLVQLFSKFGGEND